MQECGEKKSGVLYISLFFLIKRGIKSSAIDEAKNEIHWTGLFLNNLLSYGFSWLIALLLG